MRYRSHRSGIGNQRLAMSQPDSLVFEYLGRGLRGRRNADARIKSLVSSEAVAPNRELRLPFPLHLLQ